MNPVTSFVAVVSLLLGLAVAGNRAEYQTGLNRSAGSQTTPSKIALNHNETMVVDAASVQQTDRLSQWLTTIQTFFFVGFTSGDSGRKGGCDEWGCGTNHNETMVREPAS